MSLPKAKSELSGLTLTQEAYLKDREGGVRNSAAVDFAEALWWRYERCEKCTVIGGGHVQNNLEVKILVAITFFFISAVRFVSIPTPYVSQRPYI